MYDDSEYQRLTQEDLDRIRAKNPERYAEMEREVKQMFESADRDQERYAQKAEIGKSILFSIIGVIAFYICLFVLGLALSFFFVFLFKIPIVSQWVSFIFSYRGDSPDVVIKLGSVILSALAVGWMIRRFCDIQATKKLSLIICSAILFAINTLFLVQNIMEGGNYPTNILIMIMSLVMIGTSGS